MTRPRWKRILRTAALSGALLASSVLIPATAAHASASCTGWYPDLYSWTTSCSGGGPTFSFRPVVDCFRQGHTEVTVKGVWHSTGATTVTCPAGYESESGRWQTTGS
jgi:ABC-type glycerol-3-phosphate transport system substrate-binding protein